MISLFDNVYWLAVVGLLLALGIALYFMGQPVICECGYIKFWHGDPVSAQNSKHLTDWYTLSHIIHGIILYWIIDWLAPGWPLALKVVFAVMPEVVWELVENMDTVIEYYRQNTVSVDYTGDSVLNSISDVAAMIVGFGLAYWLPWPIAVVIILILEGVALGYIRDNLTLNIIMFLYPFEFISEWQSATG